MFETDEDFDIDEDFLKGVFGTESDALQNITTNEIKGEKRSSFGEESSDVSKKHKQADNENDSSNLSCKFDSETVNLNVPINNGYFVSNDVNRQLNSTTKKTNRLESLSNNSTQDLFAESQGSRHSLSGTRHPVKLSAVNSATPRQSIKTVSRQRKFPGPAGLYPLKGGSPLKSPSSDVNFLNIEDESPLPNPSSDDNSPNNENPGSSQSTVRMFEAAAWQQMLRDFELTDDSLPMSQFNIAWIKSRAMARQLFDQKIPFLAVLLRHLDCSSVDPCVVLQDKTGEMHGMLHREVWEQYGGHLNVGSVLVLRDMGVLSASLHKKRHFLNITCNNVLSLYNNVMHNGNPTGEVKSKRVQQITQQELMKTITDWQACQSSIPLESRVPSPANSLFSTFGSPVGGMSSWQGRGTPQSSRGFVNSNQSRDTSVNHRHLLNTSASASSPLSTATHSRLVFSSPTSHLTGGQGSKTDLLNKPGSSNVIDRPTGSNNSSFVFNPQSTSVSNTSHSLPGSSSTISTPKYKGGFTPKVSSFAGLSSTPKVNEIGNMKASTATPVMKNNNMICSSVVNYNNIFTLNKTGNNDSDLDVLEGLDCSSFFDEF